MLQTKRAQAWLWAVIALVIVGIGIFFLISPGNSENQESGSALNSIEEESQTQGSTEQTGEVKEFEVTARQFEFIPETIEVNKGDTVRLNIQSTDVTHGIAIPEFGVNRELQPGKKITVEFEADKSGTFNFYCSVYCGSGHGSMNGQLIVN